MKLPLPVADNLMAIDLIKGEAEDERRSGVCDCGGADKPVRIAKETMRRRLSARERGLSE